MLNLLNHEAHFNDKDNETTGNSIHYFFEI